MYPDAFTTSDSDADFVPSVHSSDTSQVKKPRTEFKYKCSFPNCGKDFLRQVYLDRHEFKEHTGVRKHVCTYEGCTKSYTISTHLKRHIKTFHEQYRAERTIKCSVDGCNKMFDSPYNMERHLKNIHVDPKMYACPNCSKEFHRKSQLRRHIVSHTGEMPFKCDKCSQGFIYKGLFEKHVCDLKMYKCDQCELEFGKWTLLVAHKRQEHPTFKCDQCQKTFKRNTYLKNHLETHKDKNEREVLQCPKEGCDRVYTSISNLRYHITINHEGKRFKCPVENCGKELLSKRKLNFHAKQHAAPAKKKNTERKKQEDKKRRKDAGTKKVSCVGVLSGVVLDHATQKLILEGQGANIQIAEPSDTEISTMAEDDRDVSEIVQIEAIH